MNQCIPALYSMIIYFSCSVIPRFTYSFIHSSFDKPNPPPPKININQITIDGSKQEKNPRIYSHQLFGGLGTISVFLFVAFICPACFLDSAKLPPYLVQGKKKKKIGNLGKSVVPEGTALDKASYSLLNCWVTDTDVQQHFS